MVSPFLLGYARKGINILWGLHGVMEMVHDLTEKNSCQCTYHCCHKTGTGDSCRGHAVILASVGNNVYWDQLKG